ncbi:MAG TPA: hypothetical protein VGR28_08360, partial [Candidatus Thermoplasmatota archaeon]|nr:hypothetical protein [Candidatus Thermoplasmatota archaeon]
MEKKLSRAEFAAALQGAGAKLKPEVAADPAKALKKMPAKAREQMLAQLGLPGGGKIEALVDGDMVVLRAEGGKGVDRFAAPAPTAASVKEDKAHKKEKRFGRKSKDAIPQGPALAEGTGDGNGKAGHPVGLTAAGPLPVPADLLAPDGKGPSWKPTLTEHQQEIDLYPVHAPFAWVRIVYDEDIHETTYNILEPPLNEREQRVLSFLEDTLVDVIEIPLGTLTAEKKAEQVLLDHVNQIIYDYSILLDDQSKAKLMYYVQRDFLGFGLIDAIMRDDLIEDVSCDGPHVPIFIYHRKHESLKSNVQFMTHEALDGFVIRLAQRSGKHISIAEPLLDATLPDG